MPRNSLPKYWATPYGKHGPPAEYLNDRNVIPAPEQWAIHHPPPPVQYWPLPAYSQPSRWQNWRSYPQPLQDPEFTSAYASAYGSFYGSGAPQTLSPYSGGSALAYGYREPAAYAAPPTYAAPAVYAAPPTYAAPAAFVAPPTYAAPVTYAPPLSYSLPPTYAAPAAVPLAYSAPVTTPLGYGAPAYYY
eukprot:EG_transcript_23085